MKCPRCQHENREGRRFCAKCGAALAPACPHCGFTNEPNDEFCGGCGARLGAAKPAQDKFTSPDTYTPKYLAEKILTSKSALEGERKQVTVLFADLKGSMELLADRDPEEARKILDPVLERMMEAVHRYEGTVNQVMGDGIMALFGAPLAHEDHAVRGDPVLLLEAHHSLGPTLYGSGDLETAELHIREGLAQYDPQRHRAYASIYGGHDTGVCCLNFAALTAWTQGYPDRALRYNQEALRLAGQLTHPASTALALYYAAWVHHQRGEATAAVEKAVAALDTGHGVQTGGRATLLARLGLEGSLEEAELDQLHENLRSPWWLWTQTFASCLLAEAYARAGRPDRGLAVLAEIPEHSLEMVYSSEIYRCRGELLLSQGHAHAPEAENCFRAALDLARRGGRRSLELRAATSLSRLLQRQGKREDARYMLGEIHSWFTEGFDTADLRNARTLLDELSATSR